ncbi:hypothetical protein SAMN02799624_04117 [Paenibacillus sp. UNC496MF]|uniref:DUF5696 domain-containing protein n=1 Tax=Paenibacillus sp. UNC496MF TaxID=1502753 RepID=UPI0008F448D4|nr:DUF5696 domain-containing protein [Paenibacillus sp. UNC496MF]SFJ33467.1 hypothetical protein SAMN02799624_04117 [Paenibacillus sp. UNC496MF]
MKRKTKWYAALACAGIIAASAFAYRLYAKGAPAADIAAFARSDMKPAAANELTYMADGSNAVPGMKLVARTDALALYMNPDTTEIAVLNRASGKAWHSNPGDIGSDAKASPFEKDRLAAQVTLNYRDSIGTLGAITNFTDSIQRKQFKAEGIENGVRITYTIGDTSLGIDALPKRIGKKRFEEKVLGKLDKKTADYVSNRYYPLDDNPDVLERLDTEVSRALVLKRMLDAFAKAGYTPEDLKADNDENGASGGSASAKPNFTIPIEYRLSGDSLLVRVPVKDIQESPGYQIRSVELLDFFGAAGQDEQGYMLVPDGSGSLIHLNNGKTGEEVYAQRVYGDDENDNSKRRGQIAEAARLPVFGMKTGDEAWFATIEKGEGIASINADISGRKNSYNSAYASFAIRGEDELELYKGNKVDEFQLLTDDRFAGDIQLRYDFLSGDRASYSGMAALYRNNLAKEGVLQPLKAQEQLPFYVDLLGAVDIRKSFLGVPYKGLMTMTTIGQASQIAKEIQAAGVSNVQMRYVGWFNEGIDHTIPETVKLDGQLGSKSDLSRLAAQLKDMGGNLYPDVAFQHVLRENHDFKPASDAARFVTREQALLQPYDRALNAMNAQWGSFYLLSPAKLPYFVDQFVDSYKKYKMDSVALRDMGDTLTADYRVNRVVFRDVAKNIVTDQLGKIEKSYPNVMLTGGNQYALKYADRLLNVPMASSAFSIEDEAVPFYEMVVHGYKEYAGAPINLDDEQDLTYHLLRSLEYGAAPHFFWSYESSSKLKLTAYESMFSTHYSDWLGDAADLYGKLNSVLAGLQRETITEHARLKPGVVKVGYSNGTSIYVNYTDQPVAVQDVRIGAKNFTVGGDGP